MPEPLVKKNFRCSIDQWQRWAAAAEKDGLSQSAWIRRNLDAACNPNWQLVAQLTEKLTAKGTELVVQELLEAYEAEPQVIQKKKKK